MSAPEMDFVTVEKGHSTFSAPQEVPFKPKPSP
jgi:hypothetical protein